jgi:hypothetical protein
MLELLDHFKTSCLSKVARKLQFLHADDDDDDEQHDNHLHVDFNEINLATNQSLKTDARQAQR